MQCSDGKPEVPPFTWILLLHVPPSVTLWQTKHAPFDYVIEHWCMKILNAQLPVIQPKNSLTGLSVCSCNKTFKPLQ